MHVFNLMAICMLFQNSV